MIINYTKINILVCEALGLDPKRTGTISMKFSPKEISVEVETFVDAETVEKFTPELKKYRLVPIDEGS